MESCHFRDLASEFEELGASRVGISADPVDRQKQFEEPGEVGYMSEIAKRVVEFRADRVPASA